MNTLLLRTYLSMKQMLEQEDGQDMVEYALVISLISIVAVTGLHTLAGKITGVFSTIGADL
jgi:pilus assembly protein Flp/PilA